jgi:hypothetical protein
MLKIERNGVNVTDVDTEIIEAHDTPHELDRTFNVNNGDKPITVTAYGSHDAQNWEERDSKQIAENTEETLIVGPTINWVKLVGKTMSPGDISIVDASLEY